MAKILEFPEDRSIQKKLNGVKKDLKDLFDSIKLCYETIEKLEDKVSETEMEYDQLFAKYVQARGLEQVEVEYIEFVSGNLQIDIETGEISYETPEGTPEPPKPSGAA
tara:strand:- start:7 stop:330 length:324 start_codon:yes stop_codon:yes gene_type:complete